MASEIRVPTLGESVSEATVGTWFKKEGDAVKADEPLVELETEKVTLEVPAPAAGVLGAIEAKNGGVVGVGALLGSIDVDGAAKAAQTAAKSTPAAAGRPREDRDLPADRGGAGRNDAAGAAEGKRQGGARFAGGAQDSRRKGHSRRTVAGTGKDGRVTKADALAASRAWRRTRRRRRCQPVAARAPSPADDAAREERVRMSRLRQTIARRLKDAQNTAAMLTTFNEVDMSAVMQLRTQYRDLFEKKHGIKLGFMGFFVKACVQALKEIPAVNAEIDGKDLVYKNYYHIGIAVGTEKGLVVPVVRDADQLSLADIEKTIADSASAPATASSRSRRCRAAPSPSPTAASTVR